MFGAVKKFYILFLFVTTFSLSSYALETVSSTDLYMSQFANGSGYWSVCEDLGGSPIGIVRSDKFVYNDDPVSIVTWSSSNQTFHYRFDIGAVGAGVNYSLLLNVALLDHIGETGDIKCDPSSAYLELFDSSGKVKNIPVSNVKNTSPVTGGVGYNCFSCASSFTSDVHLDGCYVVLNVYYTAGTIPVKYVVAKAAEMIQGFILLEGSQSSTSLSLYTNVQSHNSSGTPGSNLTNFDESSNVILPSVKIYYGSGLLSSSVDFTQLEYDVSFIRETVSNIDANLQAIADQYRAQEELSQAAAGAAGDQTQDVLSNSQTGLSGINNTLVDSSSIIDSTSTGGYALFLASTLGHVLYAHPSGDSRTIMTVFILSLCFTVLGCILHVFLMGGKDD